MDNIPVWKWEMDFQHWKWKKASDSIDVLLEEFHERITKNWYSQEREIHEKLNQIR